MTIRGTGRDGVVALKINQIRDVVAAAQFGSIRAAARGLNIAQPALTRSIRAIERELGVPLFERTQHGVQLTRLGSAFLMRAQSVQIELRRAKEEIRQMQGEMQGTISIAMSPLVAWQLMPDALRSFHKNYPLAGIEVCEGLFETIELGMIRSQHDCYIGSYSASEKRMSYQVEKLLESDRVILARCGHPQAGATTWLSCVMLNGSRLRWIRCHLRQISNTSSLTMACRCRR